MRLKKREVGRRGEKVCRDSSRGTTHSKRTIRKTTTTRNSTAAAFNASRFHSLHSQFQNRPRSSSFSPSALCAHAAIAADSDNDVHLRPHSTNNLCVPRPLRCSPLSLSLSLSPAGAERRGSCLSRRASALRPAHISQSFSISASHTCSLPPSPPSPPTHPICSSARPVARHPEEIFRLPLRGSTYSSPRAARWEEY